jgi:glutamyl-tRNA synthetase
MEIFGDIISHSSDYFDLIYDYGVKIIEEGHAYADDTPAEQVCLRFNPEGALRLTVDCR